MGLSLRLRKTSFCLFMSMKILPFKGKVNVMNNIFIQGVFFLTNFPHHKKGKLAIFKDNANGLRSLQEIQLTTISTGKWQSMGDISVRCSLLDNLFHSWPSSDPTLILKLVVFLHLDGCWVVLHLSLLHARRLIRCSSSMSCIAEDPNLWANQNRIFIAARFLPHAIFFQILVKGLLISRNGCKDRIFFFLNILSEFN